MHACARASAPHTRAARVLTGKPALPGRTRTVFARRLRRARKRSGRRPRRQQHPTAFARSTPCARTSNGRSMRVAGTKTVFALTRRSAPVANTKWWWRRPPPTAPAQHTLRASMVSLSRVRRLITKTANAALSRRAWTASTNPLRTFLQRTECAPSAPLAQTSSGCRPSER